MDHIIKHIYRIIALLAIIAIVACSPDLEEDAQIEQPEPTNIQAPQLQNQQSQNPQNKPQEKTESTPIPAADLNNSEKELYAPASNIKAVEENNPQQSVQPVQAQIYAPPTRIGEVSKATTVKVALLIPLSGEYASLGQSFLDAAVMAIYDKYSGLASREITAKIELLPKDSGDNIETAEKATQDALQEGAKIILGPVFSKQVSAVASIAKSKNIPVITFSNNIAVAGEGVYLFGFIPEQQVTRIVQYSLSKKITNLAALVPSNPYGAAIIKQLSAEVRKNGNRIHPREYYPEDLSTLDNNIGRLARFLQDDPGKNRALFIAEGGEKLKILVEKLTASGIKSSDIQMLGTGLWDDPEVNKLANLSGGWFASSPPENYKAFEQHFIKTYSYKPDRRASLSYDAVALATTIAIAAKGENFDKSLITDAVGFNGPANGIFRFRDDGTIERGLAILSVNSQGFITIDPAPTMFNQ